MPRKATRVTPEEAQPKDRSQDSRERLFFLIVSPWVHFLQKRKNKLQTQIREKITTLTTNISSQFFFFQN